MRANRVDAPLSVSLLVRVALAVSIAAGCQAAPGQTRSDHDINASDMRARITFLASDELRGRATPSRGLDIAASYIESEFRRFGLDAPASGHIQLYRIARTDFGDGWVLALSRGDRRAWLRHARDFWGLPWAAGRIEGSLRFVGSAPPAEPVVTREAEIWVATLSREADARSWLGYATAAGASGLVFVVDASQDGYLERLAGRYPTFYDIADVEASVPAVVVSAEAMTRALERLGLEAFAASAPAAASPRGTTGLLAADLQVETYSAPNVIAIARGSDSRLREEYVLVTAHMDHLGVGMPIDGDSIYNGADDNASGTAAVLEVAEAIASLETAPRRSIVFATLSGEERGLLGSAWFVEHPPVALERVVANINIDMIGRNWEDTISVIGKPYSTLGTLVDSVAAAHAELGLAAVDDLWPAEGFFFRSDHFNFARKGIPAVFFFNGVHADYHQPSDETDKIKFEKAARVAALVYEVTLALANAEQPPRWDPRIRDRIVDDP